jgi:hypothetical protein
MAVRFDRAPLAHVLLLIAFTNERTVASGEGKSVDRVVANDFDDAEVPVVIRIALARTAVATYRCTRKLTTRRSPRVTAITTEPLGSAMRLLSTRTCCGFVAS